MSSRRPGFRPFLLLLPLLVAPPPARGVDGIAVRSLPGARGDTAVLLARGGDGGPLALAAAALPIEYHSDRVELSIVIEVDGASLLSGEPVERLGLELHAWIARADGAIVAGRSDGLAVDLGVVGPALEATGLRWSTRLTLPFGDYSLRAHVRDRASGRFGQRTLALALPAPGGRNALFLAPISGADPAWLDVLSTGLSSPPPTMFPRLVSGPPAPAPVLPSSGEALVVAWLPANADPATAVILVDALGEDVDAIPAQQVGQEGAGEAVRRLALAIDLPARSGRHRLRYDLPGGAAGSGPEVAVELRRAGTSSAWNRLPTVDLEAARRGAPMPTGSLPAIIRPGERQRLRDGYLAAWRTYAQGDRRGAVAALQALESATDARKANDWHDAVERPLLERLRAIEPSALLPLTQLYREVALAHQLAARGDLGRRDRAVGERLIGSPTRATAPAAMTAPTATTPQDRERELAAMALESFAADQLEGGALGDAVELLRRAADWAPASPRPWIAMGTLLERDRKLTEAAAAFDRAIALDSRSREARLRRARIDALQERRSQSESALDSLLAEPVNDWIAVVAAQERVRLLLDAGLFPAAADRARALVTRFPEEPSLQLGLAYALERAGRRTEGRAFARQALSAGRAFAVAPRKLYAEPPRRLLAERRSELEHELLLRLPVLAAAIDALTQEVNR